MQSSSPCQPAKGPATPCDAHRKRKLFAQQDLQELLQKEGLEDSKKASQFRDVFSLEVFDNTDYESRLPSEWVPKTPGGEQKAQAVKVAWGCVSAQLSGDQG